MPEWPSSASRSSFETSAHRSTQYDGVPTPQQHSAPGFTASDAASPQSTRAASESGDDTETEAGDERMSITSGDEGVVAGAARPGHKRRVSSSMGMDVDV